MRKLKPWVERLLLFTFAINALTICSIDRITDIIPGAMLIIALLIAECAIWQIIEKYGHGMMEKKKRAHNEPHKPCSL